MAKKDGNCSRGAVATTLLLVAHCCVDAEHTEEDEDERKTRWPPNKRRDMPPRTVCSAAGRADCCICCTTKRTKAKQANNHTQGFFPFSFVAGCQMADANAWPSPGRSHHEGGGIAVGGRTTNANNSNSSNNGSSSTDAPCLAPLHQSFLLYETRTHLYLCGGTKDRRDFRILLIDRTVPVGAPMKWDRAGKVLPDEQAVVRGKSARGEEAPAELGECERRG